MHLLYINSLFFPFLYFKESEILYLLSTLENSKPFKKVLPLPYPFCSLDIESSLCQTFSFYPQHLLLLFRNFYNFISLFHIVDSLLDLFSSLVILSLVFMHLFTLRILILLQNFVLLSHTLVGNNAAVYTFCF